MNAVELPPSGVADLFSREELPRPTRMRQTAPAQVFDFSVADPRTTEGWDAAVGMHPEATIFHTAAWARVLNQTYGHRPVFLRFTRDGDHESGILPVMEVASPITGRRGVSLPFSDFCEPLLPDRFADQRVVVDKLCLLAEERRWKYVELRGGRLASHLDAEPSATFYTHSLSLNGSLDDLFANCASSFRRAVRKAERSELEISIASDERAVRAFYALHGRTRRRHGIPPQPLAFFQSIGAEILQAGLGFIVLASSAGTPIAGAMFFHFGENALFKFGASDERYQEHRASNLVMLEGLKRCSALGKKTVHLGRTDLPQDGLRRFKLGLGATEETLHYFRYEVATRRWVAKSTFEPPEIFTSIFRRLPLTINQLAGTMLYPHLH